MIKAIMLDVDGTLVSFETHKVLPSSVDALRKIHDGGIRIVIATGRAAGDLHEIADVPYYNRQIKKFPTEKQNVSLKHILT